MKNEEASEDDDDDDGRGTYRACNKIIRNRSRNRELKRHRSPMSTRILLIFIDQLLYTYTILLNVSGENAQIIPSIESYQTLFLIKNLKVII